MLILGLLAMYFDAAKVFVTKSLVFSDWLWPYCEQLDKVQFMDWVGLNQKQILSC